MSSVAARLPRPAAVLLAAAALAACQVVGPTPTGPGQDGVVSTRTGARVGVAGMELSLRSGDGRPISDVAVLVGGRAYPSQGGKLMLPDEALREIKARGGFVLLAPGHVPRRVSLGTSGEIALVPEGGPAVAGRAAPGGGPIGAPGGPAVLGIPAGLVGGDVGIASSFYAVPPAEIDQAAAQREREAFLSGLGRPGPACDQPLPCPPVTASLGLLVRVDGPIAPGALEVTYDLAAVAAAGHAAAVERLRQTFAAIDRTGDPAWRTRLEALHGIRLAGERLAFRVTLGDGAFQDGHARIEVDGFALLGVRLEVTVVGAATPAAPATTGPSAALPALDPKAVLILADPGRLLKPAGSALIGQDGGSLVGMDGGSLIGQDGGSLIGLDGGSLIGMDGGSLIGQDGGSLVGNAGNTLISLNVGGALAGTVRTPFIADAKYRLLGYDDAPAPGATVRALSSLGVAVGAPATAGPDGAYRLAPLPVTLSGVVLEATNGVERIRGIAAAPGGRVQRANLTAGTSGIAAVVLDAQAGSPLATLPVGRAALAADVDTLDRLLDPPGARLCVTQPVPAVAAFVRDLFRRNGRTLGVPGAPLAVATPAPPPPTPVPPGPTAPTPTVAASAMPSGTPATGFPTMGVIPRVLRGGDALAFTGQNFAADLAAEVQGQPLPRVSASATSATFTLPALAPGRYPLRVTSSPVGAIYVAELWIVTPATGGGLGAVTAAPPPDYARRYEAVTIAGGGFPGDVDATMGGVAAQVSDQGQNRVTFTVPNLAPGAHEVVLTSRKFGVVYRGTMWVYD